MRSRADRFVSALLLIAVGLLVLGTTFDRAHRGTGLSLRPIPASLQDLAGRSGGVFRDATTVARALPDAVIVGDTSCSPGMMLRYRALALPFAVEQRELPPVDVSGLSPTYSDEWRSTSWDLFIGDRNRPGELWVYCNTVPRTLVQASLVAEVASGEGRGETARDQWVGRLSAPNRTVFRDIIGDTAIYALLMVLGGLIAPRTIGTIKPILALLGGIGLFSVVALSLRGPPVLIIAAVGAVLLVRVIAARRGLALGWAASDLRPAAGLLLGVFVVVNFARSFGVYWLHTDSMDYLLGGWALAAASLDPWLLNVKRGLTQQALHGGAFLLGTESLLSLSPVMMMLGLWIVRAGARRIGAPRGADRARTDIAALLMVVALISSAHFVYSASIVGPHATVAALLAAIIVTWAVGNLSGDPQLLRSSGVIVGLMGSAVVLLRPEGALVVALVLTGTLWAGPRWAEWTSAWFIVGFTTGVWNGILLVRDVTGSGSVPAPILVGMMTALGLVAAPIVLRKVPEEHVRRIAPLLLAGAWLAVVALAQFRGDRISFLRAARENVLASRGGWGILGVLLLLLLILAVFSPSRGSDRYFLAPAEALLIGFLPLSMFVKMADNVSALDLGQLLSGGGRIGVNDSGNRMWIHVLFVAALLIVLRVVRGTDTERTPPVTPPAWRARAAAILGMAGAIWVAILWSPTYVGQADAVHQLVTAEGSATLFELESAGIHRVISGEVVSQEVPLEDAVTHFPSGSQDRRLCVTLRFASVSADHDAYVISVIREASGIATTRSREFESADEPTVCVPVEPDGPASHEGMLRVSIGVSGERAQAVGGSQGGGLLPERRASRGNPFLLLGPSSRGLPPAVSRISDGPPDVLSQPLALEIHAQWSEAAVLPERALLDRTSEAVTIGLPVALAGVIVAIFMLELLGPSATGRRRRRWAGVAVATTGALVILSTGPSLSQMDGPPDRMIATVPTNLAIWDADHQFTAGDIVDDARIRQTIDPRTLPTLDQFAPGDLVCVEVLLATYDNRENLGDLRYVLSDGTRQYETRIGMPSVTDNVWTPGCFALPPAELLSGNAGWTLEVVGDGGAPGSSVTAWVRPSLGDEPAAVILGTVAGSFVEADREVVLRHRFARAPEPRRGHVLLRLGGVMAVGGMLFILADAALTGRRSGRESLERLRR